MPKLTAAVLTALLALTLAGCAGSPDSEPTRTQAPAATATETAAPERTMTEVPTGPVEVTSTPVPTVSVADHAIEQMHAYLVNNGMIVSAEQVRAAADYTCDQIAAGASLEEIVPLTGDVDPETVQMIVRDIDRVYCPAR